MIKNWKLFLEKKDPFEGDLFREEILGNVDDILSELKDNGFAVKYSYGIDNILVFPDAKVHNELRVMVISEYKEYFESIDFDIILHLNKYLISEDFEPISNSITKELDVQFRIKGKILTFPINRLKFSIEKGLKPTWIKFSYKLPPSKWRGNYVSIK